MAVKRKATDVDGEVNGSSLSKKQQRVAVSDHKSAFRADLFEPETLTRFGTSYATSGPYAHGVVPALIEPTLLRNVRSEIISNIHFTLKETDIYRIHQSGDLANLSNLDKRLLQRLPSLVSLRDAMYSHEFREWVSKVTNAGKLSGTKTDMAVNVYTPGSYLLCHDDVIGSRRVSYILYLTDPDEPWQPEWGGGLRLYPTELMKNASGEDVKVPLAEHTLNIPPGFGQLSFFTVLPGESYHDVEEVYHGANAEEDNGRIRMAISGWYHIPQEGEEGYEAGLEQALAQKSSLAQLKGAANEFDEPQVRFRHFDEQRVVMDSSATATETDPGDGDDADDDILTEQDLTFLLQYIRAQFLTPDMIEQVSASFEDTSMLQLEQFLCEKFATELHDYLEALDAAQEENEGVNESSKWRIARPPHKHRYAYLQEEVRRDGAKSPITRLLVDLLHSHAFKKWLALMTGLKTESLLCQHAIARRFRRGKDYALASAFQSDHPQLEFTINLTPSKGWEQDQQEASDKENVYESHSSEIQVETSGPADFGGEEVYMAGDDDDDDESTHSKSLPHVGKKADPAVYKSVDDGEEDGILCANAPAWNTFSVVLRDKGTLRFIKYVSQAAKGDRWDVKGEVELSDEVDQDTELDSEGIDPEERHYLDDTDEDEDDADEDEDEDEDGHYEDEDEDGHYEDEDDEAKLEKT